MESCRANPDWLAMMLVRPVTRPISTECAHSVLIPCTEMKAHFGHGAERHIMCPICVQNVPGFSVHISDASEVSRVDDGAWPAKHDRSTSPGTEETAMSKPIPSLSPLGRKGRESQFWNRNV